MKKDGRYDVSSLPEAQCESDSNEQALKNQLSIKPPKQMDDFAVRAYEWTGEYRQINVDKSDFSFAAAAQAPFLRVPDKK